MELAKFRAWDKGNDEMIFGNELHLTLNGLNLWVLDQIYKDECNLVNMKDYHLMQYTGLKDSKCNEICDGDIVLRKGKMYRIIFEIGSFMLSPIDDIDMYEEFINCWNDHVYPLAQLYFENGDLEDILSDLTILGNIYENPELVS